MVALVQLVPFLERHLLHQIQMVSDSDVIMTSSLRNVLGFITANMTRRTAIYQKPAVDACEDEPIDGPVSISISDRTQTTEHVPEHESVPELPTRIPSTSDLIPPKLPPRPSRVEPRDFNVIAEQEPEMGPETLEIPKHYQTME